MASCLVRTFRGWRLDRNPLRRRSDRAETIAGILLLVALAFAAPLTWQAAAARTRAIAEHSRASEFATRHEVTAITLEKASKAHLTPYTPVRQRWVYAAWTTPGGRPRTGKIRVPRSTPVGAPEQIWVTGNGDVAAPPLPVIDIARLAGCAGVGAVVTLTFLILLARKGIRKMVNRQRMAAWDAEWAVTGPRWNPLR